MARIRRRSVRLWQTELFVVVIVVAILILSVSLSQRLQTTLADLGEADRLSDASVLASQLGDEYPLTVESLARIREHVSEFRQIYGDDVWVYDLDGSLREEAVAGAGLPDDVLEQAFVEGLADSPPFAQMSFGADGYVVAGKAVYDADGRRAAVVVVSSSVDDSQSVLDAVRRQLWIAFWIALVVASSLGLAFAEFIGRRVRQMSKAAVAIADGDFDQRLPMGPVPDEIQELAHSYNRMAVTLGDAFSTLREREQEIAAVVESLGEGVVAFDADGTVRVINPKAGVLLGLPEDTEPFVGRSASDLTADESTLEVVGHSLDATSLTDIVTLSGHAVLLHGTPIVDADGTTQGAVLLMSDITERKALEEAQRQFVANASHEMRTPIAAIKGLLELLVDGANDDPAVRDDFMRTMAIEVDRLGRLVSNLLTLAQLEAGGLQLERESVDVGAMLADIVTMMGPLAEGPDVRLVLDAPDGPLYADCDKDRITQVLIGFIDNALRHSGGGETVTLRARIVGDSVSLEVQDEGVGIDPDAIPHLFDRFFRVDGAQTSPQGAGLGLSIAKEIIDAHDSYIHVESQVNMGTTFRFELPLER